MTFSIDNPRGGCNNPPPLGKYVWEKPSGEQGLRINKITYPKQKMGCFIHFSIFPALFPQHIFPIHL